MYLITQFKMQLQPMENPATAPWGLSLSDKDFAALKGGCMMRDMDDRWAFISRTDQELLNELAKADESPTDDSSSDQSSSFEVSTDDDEDLSQEPKGQETKEEEGKSHPLPARPATGKQGPFKAPPARGVTEQDMAQGGNISIRRTWTNTELYRLVLAVQPTEDGISRRIEAITWDQRKGRLYISEQQAKINVVVLARLHLECDLAAAPGYETSQYSSSASVRHDSPGEVR